VAYVQQNTKHEGTGIQYPASVADDQDQQEHDKKILGHETG
jgi:hypothetical protein